jgi:hypothetical protein
MLSDLSPAREAAVTVKSLHFPFYRFPAPQPVVEDPQGLDADQLIAALKEPRRYGLAVGTSRGVWVSDPVAGTLLLGCTLALDRLDYYRSIDEPAIVPADPEGALIGLGSDTKAPWFSSHIPKWPTYYHPPVLLALGMRGSVGAPAWKLRLREKPAPEFEVELMAAFVGEDSSRLSGLPLARELPEEGETVHRFGLGARWYDATVRNRNDDRIEVSGPFNNSEAGGPIVNSRDELVGIACWNNASMDFGEAQPQYGRLLSGQFQYVPAGPNSVRLRALLRGDGANYPLA